MNEQMFKERTKKLGLRVIRLVGSLSKDKAADIIGRQLLRSATSVGANYRAACRGRSKADVIAKLSLVEEEADESLYWMEMLVEGDLEKVRDLMVETREILAMSGVNKDAKV